MIEYNIKIIIIYELFMIDRVSYLIIKYLIIRKKF